MIRLRKAHDRGRTRLAWLDSYHTFSFGTYHDPRYMGYRHLRVINEDIVTPGGGFPPHSHRDMEILTYVLEGALEHKDSMGNGSIVRPGEVQRMTAGARITHSEFNQSSTEPVHFLQIWILPERQGLKPSYEQRRLLAAEDAGIWQPIASRDGRDGSVVVHQDVEVLGARLSSGRRLAYTLRRGRHAWAQVVRGAVALNDVALTAGDGAAVSAETTLEFSAHDMSEVLLFDLA